MEVTHDLVHSCMVGQVVVITGVVKVLATGDDLGELLWGGERQINNRALCLFRDGTRA